MTTDPFIEAARAEAESWIGMDPDDHDNFVSGAEWGYAQALAQEPTDAECIAILNAVTTPFGEKVQNHEWAYAGIQRCREVIMDARRKEYK